MIVADDLDAEISRLEREQSARKREKAERQDAALLLILERDVTPGVVFSATDLVAQSRLHPEFRCRDRCAGRADARPASGEGGAVRSRGRDALSGSGATNGLRR